MLPFPEDAAVPRFLRLTFLAAALFAVAVGAYSQEPQPGRTGRGDRASRADKADKAEPTAQAAPKGPELKDHVVSTRHTITLDGKPLNYLANAGTLVMRDDD